MIDVKNEPPLKKQKQTNWTSFFIGGASAVKEVKENENVNKTVKNITRKMKNKILGSTCY